jgi:hypothetical protein
MVICGQYLLVYTSLSKIYKRATVLRYFVAGILCMLGSKVFAQYNPLDTIKHYVTHSKPSYVIELDGRHSFVREAPVIIDGFRLGADFGDKVRLFVGGYWSRHKVSRTFLQNQYTTYERLIRQDISMFYVSATAEYVVYNTKHWELAVPVQIGFGRGKRTRYDAYTGAQISEIRPGFVPFEFSLHAMYRITDWLNVSAGLGYRYALFSNTVSDDFSAPLYTYGIGISPIRILKKIGVLEEKNGKLRLKQQ